MNTPADTTPRTAVPRTALPRYGKRSVFYMTLIAVPLLLMMLGRSELFPSEGGWAAYSRSAVSSRELAADTANGETFCFNAIIYGKLLRDISRIIPLSEWSLRFPAVLAATALFAGTMLLALELTDRKTSVFTGWLLLSSCGFLYWGRLAGYQMFAAAAAIWMLELFFGNRSGRSGSVFRNGFDGFFLISLTLLMCGAVSVLGIILLILPQGIYMAKQKLKTRRNWGKLLSAFLTAQLLLAALLSIVVFAGNHHLGWAECGRRFTSLMQTLQLSILSEFQQLFVSVSLQRLFTLPHLLLPWVLLVPAAVYGLYEKRRSLTPEQKRFLLGISLFIVVINSLFAENPGNMLSVLGPLMIAMAMGMSHRSQFSPIAVRSEWLLRSTLIIIASLAAALPCTWPLWSKLLKVDPPVLLMIAAALIGILTLFVLMKCPTPGHPVERIIKRQSPLAGTVSAGVILSVFVNCVFFPEMNVFRTGREFWLKCKTELQQCEPEPTMVIFYKFPLQDTALYYLNPKQPCKSVSSPEELSGIFKKRRGKIAVISSMKPEIKEELLQTAARNNSRFQNNQAIITEASPVAFVHADARRSENNAALWLLEF